MEDATLHGCIPVIIMVCACWLAGCLVMCCTVAWLQATDPLSLLCLTCLLRRTTSRCPLTQWWT
jgi:hypothetical protein